MNEEDKILPTRHMMRNMLSDNHTKKVLNECCDKLVSMHEKANGNHNYYLHAAVELRRHFGIEE